MDENLPDDIDHLFKKSLNNYQQAPPKEVWEKIDHALEEGTKRRTLLNFRIILPAAACFILLFGSLAVLHFRTRRDEPLHKTRYMQPGGSAQANRQKSSGAPHLLFPQHLIDTLHKKNPMAGTTIRQAAVGEAFSTGDVLAQATILPIPFELLPNRASDRLPEHRPLTTDRVNAVKKAPQLIKAPQRDRWAVTGYFSKEFAGYNLVDHDSTTPSGKEVDKKESSRLSASAGIWVSRRLSRHWVIQSGLIYSVSNGVTEPSTAYAVNYNGKVNFRINTDEGYSYLTPPASTPAQVGDTTTTDKVTSALHYISIPVMASYRFNLKRFSLLTGAGVSVNYLISANLQTRIVDAANDQVKCTEKMYGLRQANFGVVVKTELQYALSPHYALNFMATFKNSVTAINANTSVSTYPYNLGFGLGISRSF
jgi:hypothetical protein